MPRVIIAVTGMPASRKSLFAEKLKDLGYEHIILSNILRSRISDLEQQDLSPAYMKESSRIRKELGEDILAKLALQELALSDADRIVIDGVRCLPELNFLEKNAVVCYLVAVQAGPVARRKRLMHWPNGYYTNDYDHVAELETHELKLGTATLIALSDDVIFLHETDSPRLDKYLMDKAREIDKRVSTLVQGSDKSTTMTQKEYVNKKIEVLLRTAG